MAPGRGVVYVSGRTRASGEMNGKSANLNNCAKQIYPEGQPIPPNEIICVFDADQVANPDFFLKMLYKFDAGDDVAMVLSPQVREEEFPPPPFFAFFLPFFCFLSLSHNTKKKLYLKKKNSRSTTRTCARTSSTTRTRTSGSTRSTATTRSGSSRARGPTS